MACLARRVYSVARIHSARSDTLMIATVAVVKRRRGIEGSVENRVFFGSAGVFAIRHLGRSSRDKRQNHGLFRRVERDPLIPCDRR